MRFAACSLIPLLAVLVCAGAQSQSADNELVSVKELIHDIVLDLKYNTVDNFAGQKLYTSDECLLALGAVRRLQIVQDSLHARGLGLKVFDAYRPRSVQYLMWEILPDPRYVADPSTGSIHNRGGAVDVSLVDPATREELLMPTPFDYFGPEAGHNWTTGLTQEQIDNRALLRGMMENVGGFSRYDAEWWHYTWDPSRSYPLRDFQLK
ncbi:MAG: M15 family metallopeptidase [Bacteroidetes bacterium]|nr:M15 family metallopeptidase [Bacteroidota bacterium]